MTDKSSPIKAGWPKWSWRQSGWWLTGIGLGISIILLLRPEISAASIYIRLSAIVIAFIFAFLVLALIHAIRVCLVAFSKIRFYDRLCFMYDEKDEELRRAKASILALVQQLNAANRVEIQAVIRHDETVYLVLKRKRGRVLEVGGTLDVLDTQEGIPMGTFEISEIRSKEYYAKNVGYIHPLWLGFIRQEEKTEFFPPPDVIAILRPMEEDND